MLPVEVPTESTRYTHAEQTYVVIASTAALIVNKVRIPRRAGLWAVVTMVYLRSNSNLAKKTEYVWRCASSLYAPGP